MPINSYGGGHNNRFPDEGEEPQEGQSTIPTSNGNGCFCGAIIIIVVAAVAILWLLGKYIHF